MSTAENPASSTSGAPETATVAAPQFADVIAKTRDKVGQKLTKEAKKRLEHDGWWEALIDQITRADKKLEGTSIRWLEKRIGEIDAEMSEQLAAIMHHDEFQKLEGTWSGLRHLVTNTNTKPDELYIDVLNCSKEELAQDMRDNTPHLSDLYRKTYSESYGTAGGVPHGILVGDYSWVNHPQDIYTLKQVAKVASASHTPFLTSPSPEFFGFDSFQQLDGQNNETLANILSQAHYIEWNELREMEESRYLVMAMPRLLARLPYGGATNAVKEFDFEEVRRGPNGELIEVPHNEFCWMNAAYALAERITYAYWCYGWTTAIRGDRNGGRVDGLPVYKYRSKSGDLKVKCPTEINLNFNQDFAASNLGFYPIMHVKETNGARFEGGQTVQKPQQYVENAANESAQLSARLPYILAASRVAHYLKKMAHEHIGSFKQREDCERWLNDWIKQYVLDDDNPPDTAKASHPFRSASVEVMEVPGDKGVYHSTIRIVPWVMLERLTADITLVGELDRDK
jgi:type VI secretion system protein ImpC